MRTHDARNRTLRLMNQLTLNIERPGGGSSRFHETEVTLSTEGAEDFGSPQVSQRVLAGLQRFVARKLCQVERG